MKTCSNCNKSHEGLNFTGRGKVWQTLGIDADVCGTCFKDMKKYNNRVDAVYLVHKVGCDLRRDDYVDAVSEIFKGISELEKEQDSCLRELRKLEKEKSHLGRELSKLEQLAKDNPSLEYEFARATANKAISNKQLRSAVFKIGGNKCKHCGSTENLTIDHIKPVFAGGGNSIDNLQLLCRPCNSSKGATF